MSLAILPKKEPPQSLKWLIPQLSRLESIHNVVLDQVGYDFKVKSNEARFVKPRQISIWLMRAVCNSSYPQIARFYSLHHTTVMYAERTIDRERRRNRACFADTELLRSLAEKSIRQAQSANGQLPQPVESGVKSAKNIKP